MNRIMMMGLCSTLLLLNATGTKQNEGQDIYYYYGYYPQSVVEDDMLYDDLYFLSEEEAPEFLNWYRHGDHYYACLQVDDIQDERYFHNGKQIVNHRKYFFLCEKVEWSVSLYPDSYGLQSTKILDASCFYDESISNYEYETVCSSSTIYQYLTSYVTPALEKEERNPLEAILVQHDSLYLDSEDLMPFKVNLPVYSESGEANSDLKKDCTDYALAKGLSFVKEGDKSVSCYWMSKLGSTTSKMLYVTEEGETLYNRNIHDVLGISPYVELERR